MGPSHVAEAARLRGEDRLGVNLITDAMMAVMEADDPGLSLNAVAEDRGWFESSIDETAVKQAVKTAVSGSKLAGKYARGNTKGFSTILKHVVKDNPGLNVIKVKEELLRTLEAMKAEHNAKNKDNS